jgi:ATP-dependent helicase/nuclease subunit A
MTLPDPNIAQRAASEPTASVWVAASAGSGKTKVLTDRVLRLMLAGTPPHRILCLTFTKAAAAEMANRINENLIRWATLSDADLRTRLADLTGGAPDEDAIARARRLFARVLDVPGGLKIQTIHSFCESLLGRFPVEARVPPHFQVMDERSAAELMQRARDAILSRIAAESGLAASLGVVTTHATEDSFAEIVQHLARERGRLKRAFDAGGGPEALYGTVFERLGVAVAETPEDIVRAACADGAFDRPGLEGEKTDQPRGVAIAGWLAVDERSRADGFERYLGQFVTTTRQPRKTLMTKKLQEGNPAAGDALLAEQARLGGVLDRCRAAVTAQATVALLQLGAAMLDAYGKFKSLRVQLDYDDLIYRARDLLTNDVAGFAAWVLYKLDGGLDHILIDEAQDTNPEQWEVIAALAEEFFSGAGAREEIRTVFAVGDVKQSIFSFQRADPKAFRDYREHFGERVNHAERTWRPVELDVSFRSADAVLRAVDTVFADSPARDGVIALDETLRHHAHRSGQAGLVELWPAVGAEEQDEEAWTPPVRRRAILAPQLRLARAVARRVRDWIGREHLDSRGRPVRAGDVMILLRRRSDFMEALVRELKALDVPVAGVDRMALTEQLAVMDLMALGRFLLLPDDDLTLATVLKGPLIGLDDDALFRLAHDRGVSSLWRRLGEQAAGDADFARARDWLAGLRARTDYTPPYELFAGVLTREAARPGASGWQRMLARLGPEAEDPIDEFLDQALAYERAHAPSLQGFLHWLEAGAVEIKRDLEQTGRDQVRVLTVHGAKGLQAPIVILPDTMTPPRASPAILWDGDVPLWPPRRAEENQLCRDLRDAANRLRDEEYRRLLYVAMTRAEDRLHVCGWYGHNAPSDDCWYHLVRRGLASVADEAEFDFGAIGDAGWAGAGLRLANPQSAPPELERGAAAGGVVTPAREPWMDRPPPPEPAPPRPLAPSRPTDAEPPVLSPRATPGEDRFLRGRIVHRLLQALPDLPLDDRHAACERFLARPSHGLTAAAQAEIAAEVMAILESDVFAPLFGPGSRAEVPIAGVIEGPDGPEVVSGQVDRLLVTKDSVTVLDYKTARPVPPGPADTPVAYLRQMAAYRTVLGGIWPGRPIRCALLWTAAPELVALDGHFLDRYGTAT